MQSRQEFFRKPALNRLIPEKRLLIMGKRLKSGSLLPFSAREKRVLSVDKVPGAAHPAHSDIV